MRIVLFIIGLCALAASATAQPLGDIDKYLESKKVYEGAKMYYRGEVATTVNDTTRQIADSLNTRNDFTRPFYLLQVSKMFTYADASLAMMLFEHCYNFLDSNADGLVEFLYSDNKFVQSDFRKYWATAIAFQLRKVKPENPKEYLDSMKERLVNKGKKKNKPQIKTFLAMIAAQM